MPVVRIHVNLALVYTVQNQLVHRSSGSHNFSDSPPIHVCVYVHLLISLSACTCRRLDCSLWQPSWKWEWPTPLDSLSPGHPSPLTLQRWAMSTMPCMHSTIHIHVHVHDIVHVFTGVYTNMLCISRMNQLLLNGDMIILAERIFKCLFTQNDTCMTACIHC